jgi:TIR domain-containing protein
MGTHDIFICFSSKDEATAREVVDSLEARGRKCWVSSRDVAPGQNYQEAIVEAIGASKVLVFLFSDFSSKSEEVNKELSLAGSRGATVIPLRLSPVLPTGALRYELATRQWIDIFPDRKAAFDRLAEAVTKGLRPRPDGAAGEAIQSLDRDPAAGRPRLPGGLARISSAGPRVALPAALLAVTLAVALALVLSPRPWTMVNATSTAAKPTSNASAEPATASVLPGAVATPPAASSQDRAVSRQDGEDARARRAMDSEPRRRIGSANATDNAPADAAEVVVGATNIAGAAPGSGSPPVHATEESAPAREATGAAAADQALRTQSAALGEPVESGAATSLRSGSVEPAIVPILPGAAPAPPAAPAQDRLVSRQDSGDAGAERAKDSEPRRRRFGRRAHGFRHGRGWSARPQFRLPF